MAGEDSTKHERFASQIKQRVLAENEEKFKTELLKKCQTILEKSGGRFVEIEGDNLLEIQLPNGVCVYFRGYSREILNEGNKVELSESQMAYVLPEPFLGAIGGGSILYSKEGEPEYRVIGQYEDPDLSDFTYSLRDAADEEQGFNTMKMFLEHRIPGFALPDELKETSVSRFKKIYESVTLKQMRIYSEEEQRILELERENLELEASIRQMREERKREENRRKREQSQDLITMQSIIRSLKARKEKMDKDTKA